MENNNINIDLFDDYLNNNLSPELTKQFEERLKTDATLKADFLFHTAMNQAVQNVGDTNLKLELKKVHNQHVTQPELTAKKWFNNTLYALGLVIVAIVAYLLGKQNPVTQTITKEITKTDTIVKVEIIKDYDTVFVEKIIEKKTSKPKQKNIKETTIKVVKANLEFVYKYFDGQLILYGEYDKAKARFAQKDGADYLVYENKVYKLEPTTVPRPLIEIPDPGLLKINLSNSKLTEKFINNEEKTGFQNLAGVRVATQDSEQEGYMYDGVYLVLYGNYKNSTKDLIKNSDGTVYLILDTENYYQIQSLPGRIQKLKPLKRKQIDKLKYKLEQNEN